MFPYQIGGFFFLFFLFAKLQLQGKKCMSRKLFGKGWIIAVKWSPISLTSAGMTTPQADTSWHEQISSRY